MSILFHKKVELFYTACYHKGTGGEKMLQLYSNIKTRRLELEMTQSELAEKRESYIMAGTNIKADFCLRASGDSMINARILDGDIVFIRKQDMVENGEIAAVITNDNSEATLKRVFYYPEKSLLILKPENPAYEDFIFQNEELNEVHILGKAIAFQSDVR